MTAQPLTIGLPLRLPSRPVAARITPVAATTTTDVEREAMGRFRSGLRGLSSGSTPEELLLAVAGGDHSSFADLYDMVAPKLHGVVLRVLRDPAQSEEVTQEVFLEIWKRGPSYDPTRGSALAWMITIAHRRAIDRVRSEQSARDRVEAEGAKVAPTDPDPVGNAVEERLEQRRVRRALESLTDIQRQAIELAYYDGLTYREVAERLDLPLGTVKTRMRDGLQRLRSEFGEAS